MRINALAAASLVLIAGCTTTGTSPMAKVDNWGEANRQTMAAQIIDPTPTYEYASPETAATQVVAAIDRVRTDKVKKPERVKTSAVESSGSGGK